MKYSLPPTSSRYWLPMNDNMPPISKSKGSTFARIACSSCRSLCSSASSRKSNVYSSLTAILERASMNGQIPGRGSRQ